MVWTAGSFSWWAASRPRIPALELCVWTIWGAEVSECLADGIE
ncbi:hypothetical protein E3A20_21350, partial [Planctomyces bekefii]